MRNREDTIEYEAHGHYVTRERGLWQVWRHKGTHAVSDSAYRDKSLAVARCECLARLAPLTA